MTALIWCLSGPVFAGERIFYPVRYWGDISYEQRIESYEEGEDQTRKLAMLNLSANTFIWQPWFLNLNGGLGLAYNELDRDDDDDSTGEIITGNAQMLLLPQSRFPLELHYKKQDSRVTGDASGSLPYTNTNYGFVQNYRSIDKGVNLRLAYDQNQQETETLEKDTSKILNVSASKELDEHQIRMDANNEKTEQNTSNISYERNNAVLRHSYRPGTSFSMENTTSIVDVEEEDGTYINTSKQFQFMSNSFWRPKDKPYNINGGGRYYSLIGENGLLTTDSDTLNAYTGVNYDVSKEVRIKGNITISRIGSSGTDTTTSTQSTGIRYSPQYIQLEVYRYSWNTSGSFLNRTGSTDEGQHVSGQIGHDLQRSYITGQQSNLSINYSQSYVKDYDSVTTDSQRINHSVAATWKKSSGESSTYMRLMATDSRLIDSAEDEYNQIINYQLTKLTSISRKSSFSGTLTIHSSRSKFSSSDDPGFTTTSTANLGYRHISVFGVPRLHFTSDLKYDAEITKPGTNSGVKEDRKSWVNRLEYMIGRLRVRLTLRSAEVNNSTYNILMFNVKRVFGN